MKFNKKSTAPCNAISPLANDEIHTGTQGIVVKLIDYPDEKRFKKALSKMVKATIGSNPNEEIPEEVGEELFKGGLQTGLEAGIFTFEVYGLSRTCTHQIVRTRKAAFHQQSSRYTYFGNFDVRMPESIANNPEAKVIYEETVELLRLAYNSFIDMDIHYQDARFICPEGVETYIICEYPIKTFLDLYAYRSCPMFQWEIVYIIEQMKKEVLRVFPWMEPYIITSCEKTKKCMFQGWESTEDCDKLWAGNRDFKSKVQQ